MLIRKILVICFSLSLLIVVGLTGLFQASVDAAVQNLVFTPQSDSYVRADDLNANFGTLTTLRVDGSPKVNSYLRFSVSGLGGQTVNKATLSIHASSASPSSLAARVVADNTWGEKTIDYNNAPASGQTLDTSSQINTNTWIKLDVTNFVIGDGIYSFELFTPGSTSISLGSRESGASSPTLTVDIDGSSTPVATSGGSGGTSIKHFFLVVMENHSYSQVWNTNSTPYITSLGNSYTYASNYSAITHPSLPNYVDLFGGTNGGISSDCRPSSSCTLTASNLGDSLDGRGLTWKGYFESMPSPCGLKASGDYSPTHDPLVYYDDIRLNVSRCNAHVVPFTAFASDLQAAATTPNYSMIVPNMCNNMHDCGVSKGDAWLKNHLPDILNSPACTSDTCLLALTWDEGGSKGNQVLTIFAGSGAKTGGLNSSFPHTHYSLLHTVEYIFGLSPLTGNDTAADPMTDMLR